MVAQAAFKGQQGRSNVVGTTVQPTALRKKFIHKKKPQETCIRSFRKNLPQETSA